MAENENFKIKRLEMRKLSLILVFISGGLASLNPLFYGAGLPESIRYPDRLLYIPALLFGLASWCRVRSIARSWPVFACVVFSLIGVFIVEETERGRGLLIFAGIAAAVPIASLIVELKATRLCVQIFVAASVLNMLLLFFASGGLADIGRFGSLVVNNIRVSNPNGFAAQMGFAAILTMSLMQRGRTNSRTRNSIKLSNRDAQLMLIFAFLVLGILLSASRGAITTFFAVSIIFISSTKTKVLHRILLCGGLSLVMLLVLSTDNKVVSRFQDREGIVALGDRLPIWQEAIRVVQSDSRYLWYGVGTGGAEKALALSNSFENSTRVGEDGVSRKATHNSYVEWFLTHGLVGVLLAIWLLIVVVRVSLRLDRVDQSADRKMFLAYCAIISMVTALYRVPYATPLCALSLAMLSGPYLALWPKQPMQSGTRNEHAKRISGRPGVRQSFHRRPGTRGLAN